MRNSYFNNEIARANEEYMNVEGFMDFADENFAGQEMLNAEGQSSSVSDPIIFSVANTTTDDISSVECLYAVRRLASNATTGVSFTSGIPNVTYTQILNGIIYQPFTVGLTRLISTNSSQIRSVFTVSTYTMAGAFAGKPLIPNFDSYQYQTGQLDVNSPYMLNGSTSMVFATLYASATLTIQLWPSQMISQLGALSQGQAVKNYARPRINPALNK